MLMKAIKKFYTKTKSDLIGMSLLITSSNMFLNQVVGHQVGNYSLLITAAGLI